MAIGVGLAFALGGCVLPSPAGRHVRTFVGIIQIREPATTGNLRVSDVKSLGVGWDRGPWLGWRAGQWVEADPARCQLLVLIRSTVEAEGAAKVLQALKGSDICFVNSSQL